MGDKKCTKINSGTVFHKGKPMGEIFTLDKPTQKLSPPSKTTKPKEPAKIKQEGVEEK